MTRINLVHPSRLCDQHLLAELRELPRIPNGVLSGRLKRHYDDAPEHYVLGYGHVKFFVNVARIVERMPKKPRGLVQTKGAD